MTDLTIDLGRWRSLVAETLLPRKVGRQRVVSRKVLSRRQRVVSASSSSSSSNTSSSSNSSSSSSKNTAWVYNGHPDSLYTQAVLRMLLPIGTYIQYLALDKGGETVKVTAKLVRFITKDLAIEVLVTSTLVASTEPDDGSEMVVTLDASTRIRDPEKMGDFYPLRHYIHECDEKKCKHKDDEKWRSDFHRMPQKTRPSSIPFRQGYWNERDIGIDYMGTTNILLNIVHSCIYNHDSCGVSLLSLLDSLSVVVLCNILVVRGNGFASNSKSPRLRIQYSLLLLIRVSCRSKINVCPPNLKCN